MSSGSYASNPFKTVLTIGIGFSVLFVITEIKYLLWIGIAVGVLGLISTFLAVWIEKLWMLLGQLLGNVVPVIILTLIFFFFLFPIALLSRLFGRKDSLYLKGNYKSTFIENQRTFEAADFEQTF